MNKGFKSIVITLALVLALTLAVGLSACNETEYYSVSTECNVDQSIAQITVSPSTNTQGYQKARRHTSRLQSRRAANMRSKAFRQTAPLFLAVKTENTTSPSKATRKSAFKSFKPPTSLSRYPQTTKKVRSSYPRRHGFRAQYHGANHRNRQRGLYPESYTVNGTETRASADGSLSLTLKVDTQIVVNFVAHMEENVLQPFKAD